MTITKLRPTFTFDQDRLNALRAIAPEAFADGKINWEALREALGDRVEDEGRDAEHFGLFWPGKRDARRLASTPSAGTLRPAPGEGVNEETTRHVFIEGDNLEVLKLLQKAYAGRVKMIYIDPPYNTGNDFIYSDNFTQPLEEYLRATGQADEMGRVLVTNTQAGGRYHSNWLNMMYPRLRLARNLLRDDGVMFVSIDDNEVHNLRALMNDVFGEENFIASIVWQKKQSPQNDATNLSDMHEYILVYARQAKTSKKDEFGWQRQLLPRGDEQESRYTNPDDDPRGDWASVDYTCNKTAEERPNLYYPLRNPHTGKEIWPTRQRVWLFDREAHEQHVRENRIWWGSSGENFPRLKRFRSEVQDGIVPSTWWERTTAGDNQEARRELRALFSGIEDAFDTPKPVRLINRILEIGTSGKDEDIILDFFAGSCTTAQAVLQANRMNSGHRRFVMVQLPEPALKSGFPTIAEIGKERIRRATQRMQAEDAGKLTTGRDAPEDLGFRVFKLDRSDYKAWRDFEGGDVAELQTLFDRFESPLVEGWKPVDVLVEVMLMEGFPLDSSTEVLPEFPHNTVTRVLSDLVGHRLFVCLDAAIHNETITRLALGDDDVFICLDAALTDEAKVQLEDGRRVKVI